jgi:hypothetical protein
MSDTIPPENVDAYLEPLFPEWKDSNTHVSFNCCMYIYRKRHDSPTTAEEPFTLRNISLSLVDVTSTFVECRVSISTTSTDIRVEVSSNHANRLSGQAENYCKRLALFLTIVSDNSFGERLK